MRTCGVALTDAGRSVLEGRTSAVELNGIDEWVLGVHISSEREPCGIRNTGDRWRIIEERAQPHCIEIVPESARENSALRL